MAACNAAYFIALVGQQEALEGLDEIVAFVYFRALVCNPTSTQILQSPIWLFFIFLLCEKSLRPLRGFKKHLSSVFRLLIQITLCSGLVYHRSVELQCGWCLCETHCSKAKVMLNRFGTAIKKWRRLSLSFRLKVFCLCHTLPFSTSSEILKWVVLTTAGTCILLHLHLKL